MISLSYLIKKWKIKNLSLISKKRLSSTKYLIKDTKDLLLLYNQNDFYNNILII